MAVGSGRQAGPRGYDHAMGIIQAAVRCASVALLFLAPGLAVASSEVSDGGLDEGLAEFDGFTAVFVRMDDQLFPVGGDYERFAAEQPASCKRLELREKVLQTLREKAGRSYGVVREALQLLVESDDVRGVQRFWIVNGFACEATSQGCKALSALPGVGFVYRQRKGPQHRVSGGGDFDENKELTSLYQGLLKSPETREEAPFELGETEVPWNLRKIGADEAWTRHGITGKGVVVAILDDGMMTIPALLPALWTNKDEQLNGKDDDGNGLVDDVFGYDFKGGSPYCVTPSGHRHGSLCASVVAARSTVGDDAIAAGVAPGALVMPLIGGGRLLAYEYALEQSADVLSMSYTFEPSMMGHYRGLYRTAHEHLSAAGILSVGGAGNYAEKRPVGEQIGSTKDVPCVVAAAGVGPDGVVTSFSSRGPVSWSGIRYFDPSEGSPAAPIKPDVTACNAGFPMWTLREVWTGAKAERAKNVVRTDAEGYTLVIGPRGNSFAGPHAAGVAALMLEASPELPVWQLQRLMEATCEDMGEPGRDTTHGAGMLQAHKAVEAALAYRFE